MEKIGNTLFEFIMLGDFTIKKIITLLAGLCLVILFTSINATDAQAASYDKAYASKNLTVKSSPGTSYKTLGKIKIGKVVKVYGGVEIGKDQYDWESYRQYGWSKIKYKNKTAYVKTHELNFSNPYT
ncbi:SH3 domain-containing protein [Viridibacillus sp. NPDC093762]|uniref:SH3 domain-containing protein n=1 Tax=Viridibacillus sp. NPDC093762 TaxID=3390720 RepID=UPI003D059491